MMDKLSCNVVKDLLPLYSDQLVSRETATDVEAHLADCPDCRQALEDVQAPTVPALEPNPAPGNQRDEIGDRLARRVKVTVFALAALFLLIGMLLAGGVFIFGFVALMPPLYTLNYVILVALVLGLLGAVIWVIYRVLLRTRR